MLRKFLARLFARKGQTASPRTAAYCKARARLGPDDLDGVHRGLAAKIPDRLAPHDNWCGRRVKVVDGSSVSMPDTPENQRAYPQPQAQKPGCGFPVMRIVAMFSLASGVIIELARDALSVHERDLFRRLWHLFEPRDVALADRGFCSFADIYHLGLRGVDCVMRKNQGRKSLKAIKRLGKNDRIVRWEKTMTCPTWLTREQWKQMPDTMDLREIKVAVEIAGFRTQNLVIVTTLLDRILFPAGKFAELYRRRWAAELSLRDIKTTMGMEVLRCKSPRMVEKEVTMYLIAHNLVRAVMMEAATAYRTPITELSFKGTVATIRQWAPIMADDELDPSERADLYLKMLYYIAKDQLPQRPNRSEPRAIKRRPKAYQYLTKPRGEFNELPHKSRYRKA